jgi:hypothetical protein
MHYKLGRNACILPSNTSLYSLYIIMSDKLQSAAEIMLKNRLLSHIIGLIINFSFVLPSL